MKESIKEFPWNIFNLPERPAAAYSASQVKIKKGFVYLFLFACLACFHNTCAAAGDKGELLAVKNVPVNIVPLHNPAKSHSNGSIITSNKVAHGSGRSFFDLLFEELKSAAPGKVSPKQVDKGNNKNPILTELSANIDKLCHILLAYFIPAVMFFISVPALIFYWAHGSLKSERRMIETMKYNFTEVKKQADESSSNLNLNT